jgi:Zn-finger nucleic acid-binding protein
MQIKVDCPQCGGDIIFDEEIEVVRCPYCSSTNQISGKSGLPRFMLPPRWSFEESRHRISTFLSSKKSVPLQKKGLHLVYGPYWRTKGMVFHWALGKKHSLSKVGTRSWDDAKELKTKHFDFTFPAYREPDLGLDTLGVRTAAIPLQLFHHSRLSGAELVLSPEVSLQEAVDHSNSFLTFGFSDRSLKVELEDTQLVGEVYSLVYFPFWVLEVGANGQNGLLIIDGVANVIRKSIWEQDFATYFQGPAPDKSASNFGDLHLIPFTCPVCGWDLPFTPDSKTHICPTCARAWAEHGGSYQEVDYHLVGIPSEFDQPVHYMPFWKLKTQIHTPNGVLKTKSDLGKLIPALSSGKGRGKGADSIRFLIPAFRIRNLKSLSKLAHIFCVSPPSQKLRAKDNLKKERFEGVSLAGQEAEQLAQVVLISMVPKYHRRARNLLKDSELKAGRPQLVYYPFYRKGIYFREANSNHSIQFATVVLNSQS